MDGFSKDYMLDQAMASIAAFKKASEVVNAKGSDKVKKLTPTQKLKSITEFIDSEYDRIFDEYNNIL